MSEILSRALSQLACPVKIHSRVLDADVWLVPGEAADRSLDAPAYTVRECAALLAQRPSAGQLRAVHLIKTMLEGEVAVPAASEGALRRREELVTAYRKTAERVNTSADSDADSDLLRIARQLSFLLFRIDGASRDPDGAP